MLAALGAMQARPASLTGSFDAALAFSGSAVWGEIEAWCVAEPQGAVIAALDAATKESDWRKAQAFGQPYGLDALGSDSSQIGQIESGLYTDLGDPPLLATARHLYLARFDDLACLAHVEATRLAASGDPAGAIDVLTDLAYFARQVGDREFFEEKAWAMRTMAMAMERVRDVAYADFRGEQRLEPEAIETIVERLDGDRGVLGVERIQLPRGDFLAAQQLIATVTDESGRVREELFAPTMARLGSTERPLRLFGEQSRWREAASVHAARGASEEMLTNIRSDFEFRWPRSWHDPIQTQPVTFERLTTSSLRRESWAVLTESVPDMRELATLRQLLRVEVVGTRQALGLLGFFAENKAFPRDVSAIRPRFVPIMEADAYNPDLANNRKPPMQFFVPMRDTKDRFGGRDVEPHEINLLDEHAPNVSVRLRDDQFVVYSVGPDGARQWADEVQNTPDSPSGRDYLIWPPRLTLVRQALRESGQLK